MFQKISYAIAMILAPLAVLAADDLGSSVSNANPAMKAAVNPNVARIGGTATRGYNAAALRAYNTQNYFMVNTIDVDTACREKIYNCLSEYCGDMTAVPGYYEGRCTYATEGELYNYATLCIQKDFQDLMPQYSGGMNNSKVRATNTAARLCPTYIQQEVISYLSMSNMAGQLALKRSSTCTDARSELSAALSCHETTMVYANQSSSMLESMLTDSCGNGVAGGSRAMVEKFLAAGNVGGNVWGWVDKLLSLDASNKTTGWESSIDAIAASYVNKMNAACGENMQFQAVARAVDNSPTTLQQVAGAIVSTQFPSNDLSKAAGGGSAGSASFPTAGGSAKQLAITVNSNYAIYDYATASQVVQAGLTNPITTQNPFLTSQQMSTMQNARKNGTKVFMIKDQSRCFVVAADALTEAESNILAPQLASCSYN